MDAQERSGGAFHKCAERKTALITAGCVFTIVSAAHWVRYFRADEVIVSGSVVPVWWSLILGVVILALAV